VTGVSKSGINQAETNRRAAAAWAVSGAENSILDGIL